MADSCGSPLVLQVASVASMLSSDAEGIHQDGVSVANGLKAVLQRPAAPPGSVKKSTGKKQPQQDSDLDAEALGGFLLSTLSSCLDAEATPLASGPGIGLMALECLRGWASPGSLLDSARLCLTSFQVTDRCPSFSNK